ncbi:hypothetical protein BpHYR1_007058 [Brachionus plicatilis]|uniref:Uncharacterized protein n=1 Tax=Brachionus plicatilis TaxID=10195 RepID=A0A3M7PDJ4_BRAPC|nr:hypothetical protein BpHYR1_007058 [Brachionus plicatilis]
MFKMLVQQSMLHFVAIDPDLDELHLQHDHNTHFFHKNTNHSELNKIRKKHIRNEKSNLNLSR